MLVKCNICPRGCLVDRSTSSGFCGAPEKIAVSRISLHQWEEPPISGERGSGTIFFSGCNLRCVFCQNKVISSQKGAFENAKIISAEELARSMLDLAALGAHNINLVTPTHYASAVKKALEIAKKELTIPVVYNSSGYESVETLRSLSGLIDVYLPDLKYVSSELSSRYSAAPDYFEVASSALVEMHRQVGAARLERGLMTGGVIVRHLVLPSCRHDSIKILEALAQLLPVADVKLSLMRQYTPDFVDGEKFPELARRLTSFEYESVAKRASELGFDGYVQSAESATSKYTPSFNCPEAFFV